MDRITFTRIPTLPGPSQSRFTAIRIFAPELSGPSCERRASQTTIFNQGGECLEVSSSFRGVFGISHSFGAKENELTPEVSPNEQCPNCHRLVADWHVEWYKTEGPSLYQGLAALDCPLCRQPVGFQGGKIGPAPPGVPLITRQADQAAEWAASQAISAGGTLQGYTSVAGAGAQYAAYWTPQEVLQADAHRRAKQGGP